MGQRLIIMTNSVSLFTLLSKSSDNLYLMEIFVMPRNVFNKISQFTSFFPDWDMWSKYKPSPVDIKTGSVYDNYDIYEELGT